MIKISMKKAELLAALDRVRSTLSSSDTIALHKMFCFSGGQLRTYNGKAGTMTSFEMGGMDFCISGEKFYRLINSLFENLDISFNPKNGNVKIKSGGNDTKLNTVETKAFPHFIPEKLEAWTDGHDLVTQMGKVLFNVGRDAQKPQLQGVGVRGEYVYSSDLKRMSRAKISKAVLSPSTIPAEAVEHLLKLGTPTSISKAGGGILAFYSATNTFYYSLTIGGNFPFDIADATFTAATGNQFYTFPPGLMAAIDRVVLLASSEETAIIVENAKVDTPVTNPDGTQAVTSQFFLSIYTESQDGNATEHILWEYPHPFKFKVSPQFLKAAWETHNYVDLTDVATGINRMVRFTDIMTKPYTREHIVALMA